MILVIFFSNYANAYDERRTKINLIDDYTKCTAFWVITKNGGENTNDNKLIKIALHNYQLNQEKALLLATEIGVKTYTVHAAIINAHKRMGDEMSNDFANYPILTNKYLMFCNELSKDPNSRLEYWREK